LRPLASESEHEASTGSSLVPGRGLDRHREADEQDLNR
jgi:hypothetical protein